MMTPASGGHGVIAGRIFAALYAHVERHRLGVCFPDNTGFLLTGLEDTVRSPDAAFVALERLPPEGFGAGWVRAAPNLVSETVGGGGVLPRFGVLVGSLFAGIEA